MGTKKRWSELTGTQQQAIVAVAAAEMVLTSAALVDLARRPAAKVRGRKWLWALACFVQPVGPVAYLSLARRD